MNEDKRHYFVDEAGDLALFNRKGKVIVGSYSYLNRNTGKLIKNQKL